MEWQPIDTAPMFDPVLVWDYHGMVTAHQNPSPAIVPSMPPGWWLDLPYGFEEGVKPLQLHPTHWMPLPVPPAP